MSSGPDLSDRLRGGAAETLGGRLRMVVTLALPSIMAQLSAIVMEYIDAAMVGSLGANASASIGLVSTTTWLFWGVGTALVAGFAVQVAHLIGAGRDDRARRLVGGAISSVLALGVLMALLGVAISGSLPRWLGGSPEVCPAASTYFAIFSSALPVLFVNFLASSFLRSSGNTLVPGMLNVAMCVLDVVFNFFLIFPSRELSLLGWQVAVPGAGMGVMGAAVGTVCAEVCTGALLLWYLLCRSPRLRAKRRCWSMRPTAETLRRAWRISAPMGGEHIVMCSGQVFLTTIVAPLGTAAIAANAFAVTAESLCYMPGFGISDAATTLVGQSLGASRRDLARRFAHITVAVGVAVMTVMGVLMWLAAPLLMELFTPDETVRSLGVMALRVEAWAEPMYAASIVAYGVFVGAGDTLVPSLMNLGSIWIVRITLAALLAPIWGLYGVWLAMCVELCFRGAIFLWRMAKVDWTRRSPNLATSASEAAEAVQSVPASEDPFTL